MARVGRYDLDLPSLRSAAPSQDRKSENSNAHGITPVQNYICQRSFIIALRGNHVQMAKDMRQRIYLAVFMLLTYRAMSALGHSLPRHRAPSAETEFSEAAK